MTHNAVFRAIFLATALGVPAFSCLADEPVPCADELFAVNTEDSALGSMLCELAPKIREELAKCGLFQANPLILEVTGSLNHGLDNCLASYDCDHNTVRLTDPTQYEKVVEIDSAYGRLPPDVLMRNALTHELVHAMVSQSAQGRAIAPVDHEYIAAALELELMDPEWRDILVAAAPVSLPPKTGLIDIWIYRLEPRKFATNAWQHFNNPGNGCDLVRRIVEGESTLSKGQRR